MRSARRLGRMLVGFSLLVLVALAGVPAAYAQEEAGGWAALIAQRRQLVSRNQQKVETVRSGLEAGLADRLEALQMQLGDANGKLQNLSLEVEVQDLLGNSLEAAKEKVERAVEFQEGAATKLDRAAEEFTAAATAVDNAEARLQAGDENGVDRDLLEAILLNARGVKLGIEAVNDVASPFRQQKADEAEAILNRTVLALSMREDEEDELEDWLNVINNADQKIALEGDQKSSYVVGSFYRRGNAGLLIINGLKQPSTTQTYQLWLMLGSTPVPAGLPRQLPRGGPTVLRLILQPGVQQFDAVAVSLEPAGGRTKPSGPVVLVGKR